MSTKFSAMEVGQCLLSPVLIVASSTIEDASYNLGNTVCPLHFTVKTVEP
jgi:hypothetical protein